MRTLVAIVTAVAVLAQGAAWATVPVAPTDAMGLHEAGDDRPPCHNSSGAADPASAATVKNDCCEVAKVCGCAAFCTSVTTNSAGDGRIDAMPLQRCIRVGRDRLPAYLQPPFKPPTA